jgi:hypothetical protein
MFAMSYNLLTLAAKRTIILEFPGNLNQYINTTSSPPWSTNYNTRFKVTTIE